MKKEWQIFGRQLLDYILKRSFLSSSLNPNSVWASCSSFIVFLHQQRNYNKRSSSSIFRRHLCCVSKLIKFALRARCCPGNVSQFAQHGNTTFILCPARAFARPRYIMTNNVSATMCRRLPVPIGSKAGAIHVIRSLPKENLLQI